MNLNEIELEELRRFMREGGLNLAGQQTPDGSYGFYSPDFSYGSYKIPYQDPTYSSGYEYARTIAGGMPFEDVVAPGMSFSPDQPMGYTQADLRKKEIYGDFDGVMPKAPTKGTPVEASYETMPDAPVGTPMPTPYIPGETSFTGIPDFLKDLDFSGLPGVKEPSEPQFGSSAPAGFIPPPPGSFNTMAFVDYYNPTTGETWSAPSGGWTAPEGWIVGRPDGGLKFTFDEPTSNSSESSPQQDFFKADQNLLNFEEIADKIDMDEVAKINIEKIDIPESVSLFSDVLNQPVETQPTLPSIFDQPTAPVMPSAPIEPMVQPITEPVIPAQTLPQNIFASTPKPQPLSMPVMPNVEDIVRPISRQKKFLPMQPGLFNLV